MNLNIKKHIINNWGRPILLALIIVLIVRVFAFQNYKVNSTHMQNTIYNGDFILVNKLIYGARLPITPFSLPFFKNFYSNKLKLPYLRLPGFKSIEKNDLLLINNPEEKSKPIDKRSNQINRCLGLPGSNLSVKNGEIKVNDSFIGYKENALFPHRIFTKHGILNDNFFDLYEIYEGGKISDAGIYDVPLTEKQYKLIERDKHINYVEKLNPNINAKFLNELQKQGAVIKIPKRNQTISLTLNNIEIYKNLIKDHEQQHVTVRFDSIFVNNKYCTSYIFKQNYYFLINDNIAYLNDSRTFGLVPENHVIGKVSLTWFSFNKNKRKVNWDRILNSPN